MFFRTILIGTLLGVSIGCGSSSTSTPTTPSPSPSPSPSGGTSNVSIVANARTLTTTAYSPNPVNVAVGTTVTWTNNDTIAHTSTADGGAFNSGSMAAGAQFSFKFQTAGTFQYHCTFHPGMVGTIMVQ